MICGLWIVHLYRAINSVLQRLNWISMYGIFYHCRTAHVVSILLRGGSRIFEVA